MEFLGIKLILSALGSNLLLEMLQLFATALFTTELAAGRGVLLEDGILIRGFIAGRILGFISRFYNILYYNIRKNT